MSFLLWLSVVSLGIAVFASIGARSLRRFSRSKLEDLCSDENTKPLYSQIVLLRDRNILGADSLQTISAAISIGAAAAWVSTTGSQVWQPVWLWSLIGAALAATMLLAALVWIPFAVAKIWADPVVLRTWGIWKAVATFNRPSIAVADGILRLLRLASGNEPVQATEESLEEEILTIVNEGRREGLLEEDARGMIEGVIELGDVDVAQIMTPRTDVLSMHIELPWDDAVRMISKSGHTRIPVYGRSPDDIVGILHVKDLLAELAKTDDEVRLPLRQILRQPFFVPESKPVDALLHEFQRNRNHLAVVLDEFGGVCGIVTIEDALEEIVGEIADEHDDALIDGIRAIDARSAEALAKSRIQELNERLGLTLPEDEDFDTIGGFVFHELGRIPNVGEELIWHDVRIKVLEATRRRIHRVLIEVLTLQKEGDAPLSNANR